ncbi:MAG TPA: hypothetical protein VLJ42_06265 [Solirubrobacteraceae bacterium]|nr:hypothetical protein [Solirubrobacteraceae bacterium]
MARVLIVGGGCRALGLARELVEHGHAVRATTRTEQRRGAIEATGAECWIGTPDRLGTLRAALHNVTVVCWLLATASGTPEEVRALHGSRLEFFLSQIIDTTARGFVYEAPGCEAPGCAPGSESPERTDGAASVSSVPDDVMAEAVALVRRMTSLNSIPLRLVDTDPGNADAWRVGARAAVDSILA